MHLLSSSKVRRVRAIESDEKRVARLKLKRKALEEERKMSALHDDWEPKKKKMWEDFCKFNQDIQAKKAKVLQELDELERKKEILIDNLKAYIP